MHGSSASDALSPLPIHSSAYRMRRFLNWFPLGLTYAFLYWGRYNLTVAKTALGNSASGVELMSNHDFGLIFGAGTVVYALSFLFNGPLTDRIGGKRMMLVAASGSGLMNLVMGALLQHILSLPDPSSFPITASYSALYALNMYFQSMGAVAIVKVNASWFHVRERGGFGGIFGTMIASGLFFAFDVSERVLGLAKGAGPGGSDAKWWVFYAPAIALLAMFVVELLLLRDRPSQAGHQDFDTGDASSGEDEKPLPTREIFRRIFTVRRLNVFPYVELTPLLIIALIEFCTGVLRNGTMHWAKIYAGTAESGMVGHPLIANWGLALMIAGIIGSNVAGWVSDMFFQSRRAPAAGGLYAVLTLCSIGMIFTLHAPWGLATMMLLSQIAVIGVHGLLSGTATMDFGGRKAAATAVGVIDGFVYLGTALQSVSLGYLTTASWSYWPPFLVPFGLIGFLLCRAIWNARPVPRAKPAAAAEPAATPAARTGTEG